jgi:hypothetical protein
MASSFWLTSFNAWSHEIFCHLPPTNFIGVFSRCESWVMPCSRMEEPLAQCEPMLIGESNTGSCRIHTPFCTTASREQPTEQWVQIVRLTSSAPAPASCAACASPTMLNGSCDVTAPAPSACLNAAGKCGGLSCGRASPDTDRVSRFCALLPGWGGFSGQQQQSPQTLAVL